MKRRITVKVKKKKINFCSFNKKFSVKIFKIENNKSFFLYIYNLQTLFSLLFVNKLNVGFIQYK